MFKFFKEKCPVCKMELKEGRDYPQADRKIFCSEDCREKYRQKMLKMQKNSGGHSCC